MESVIIVSTAADTKSKPKDQSENRQRSHALFKDVLHAEEERLEARKEITFDMAGYSKDARPVHYETKGHAYN